MARPASSTNKELSPASYNRSKTRPSLSSLRWRGSMPAPSKCCVGLPSKKRPKRYSGAETKPNPFRIMALSTSPALTHSLSYLPSRASMHSTRPIWSTTPATIPRWSRSSISNSSEKTSVDLMAHKIPEPRNKGVRNVGRGQEQARDHPLSQALRSQRGLPRADLLRRPFLTDGSKRGGPDLRWEQCRLTIGASLG